MFYSLDRIEDGAIAVLISDGGKKTDVPCSAVFPHFSAGDVFRFEDNAYIFDEKETKTRRQRISEKKNRLFEKIKSNQL